MILINHLLYFSCEVKICGGMFSLAENSASKYIPGLGTDFKISTGELHMTQLKKRLTLVLVL